MALRPIVVAVCLTFEFAFLVTMAAFADLRQPGFPLWFTAAGIAASAVYLFGVKAVATPSASFKWWLGLWGVAILFRAVMLPAEPGDDVWRYLWEGAIQWHGANPYVSAPSSPELGGLRELFAFSAQVGHREWRTIYPPAAELIFKVLAGISPSVLLFKLCFVAADLGILAILILMLRGRADRLQVAALYAWNPLVIYTFAGAAHYDSLMMLLLVAAVWLLIRRWQAPTPEMPLWRWVLAPSAVPFASAAGVAVLLGLAIAVKLVPLALIPVFAVALQRKAPVLLLSLVPMPLLALAYGFPQVPIWESLRDFADISRTNALVWWVTEHLWRPDQYNRNGVYNYVMLAAALVATLAAWRNPTRALLWVTGTLLLLSHTLHAWYVVWLIPWACLQRSRGWLVFSGSVFGYYLLWADTDWWSAWKMHPFIWACQVVPPLLVLLVAQLPKGSRGEPSLNRT